MAVVVICCWSTDWEVAKSNSDNGDHISIDEGWVLGARVLRFKCMVMNPRLSKFWEPSTIETFCDLWCKTIIIVIYCNACTSEELRYNWLPTAHLSRSIAQLCMSPPVETQEQWRLIDSASASETARVLLISWKLKIILIKISTICPQRVDKYSVFYACYNNEIYATLCNNIKVTVQFHFLCSGSGETHQRRRRLSQQEPLIGPCTLWDRC